MRVVNQFFRPRAIRDPAERAHLRTLSRIGAYVQRRMRSSIKRRKTVSPIGGPPHAHSTDNVASLKAIWFHEDKREMSVVIGPIKLNAKQFLNGIMQSGTVPNVLENGGVVGIREKQISVSEYQVGRDAGGRFKRTEGKRVRKWVAVGRRRPRPGQATRVRMARYGKRPFAGPALDAEVAAGTIPQTWATFYSQAAA